MSSLPAKGSVAGIDVGWSEKKKTTAVCRLSWTESSIGCCIQRCRAKDPDREETIQRVVGGHELLAVAIDGPLRPALAEVNEYRAAERLLSRGSLYKRIRGAASSGSPFGQNLNAEANKWVRLMTKHASVRKVSPSNQIRLDAQAFLETFPNSFLGVMIRHPDKVAKGGKRSDRYFRHLADQQALDRFRRLFACRPSWVRCPKAIKNHEDRAAFVCALAALCVAAGQYIAAGDKRNGWIVLPPRWMCAEWTGDALQENLDRGDETGCVIHSC